jgi:hypothetical protein
MAATVSGSISEGVPPPKNMLVTTCGPDNARIAAISEPNADT